MKTKTNIQQDSNIANLPKKTDIVLVGTSHCNAITCKIGLKYFTLGVIISKSMGQAILTANLGTGANAGAMSRKTPLVLTRNCRPKVTFFEELQM